MIKRLVQEENVVLKIQRKLIRSRNISKLTNNKFRGKYYNPLFILFFGNRISYILPLVTLVIYWNVSSLVRLV